jgi:transposase
VTDGRGWPLAAALSAGQAHEVRYAVPLLEAIRIRRRRGGRPRQRPRALAGDKGYSHPPLRRWLRARRIRPVIPTRSDQRWLVTFDRAAYRQRYVAECRVGWLKERRRLATRYEKLAVHYLGFVNVAFLQRYLRRRFADRA